MKTEIKTFLDKLSVLYPIEGKTERKLELLNTYTDFLVGEVYNRNKKYDFNVILKYIQKSYEYKSFPNIPYLLTVLDRGEIREDAKLTGKEGNIIKRVVNGVEYEFTIVQNTWDKVKTTNQLDNDIAFRLRKNEV